MPRVNLDASRYYEYKDLIEKYYDPILTYRDIARAINDDTGSDFEINEFARYISDYIKECIVDKEVVLQNVRLAKQKQSQQDTNRIERKAFREHARLENALVAIDEELLKLLKSQKKIRLPTPKPPRIEDKDKIMFVQISDEHTNELVELPVNSYNYEVFSRRLKKLAERIIQYGQMHKVQKLVLLHGGDKINSDRRLDEKLNQSTNRAVATYLTSWLEAQFINDLNFYFQIENFGVTGNESRAKEEMGFSNILANDSYDYMVYNWLRTICESDNCIFNEIQANECFFQVNDWGMLLVHGHQLVRQHRDLQKAFQIVFGKYANQGKVIHYAFEGHIHNCYISDYYSRNASMVGANAYSDQNLQYVTKASQNIHIMTDHGSYFDMESIRVDLQNTDNIEPYNMILDDEMVKGAYNSKSQHKTKQHTTIFEVRI